MSLEKRQRSAFFVLALLLHAGVFYLVFHLVIFSAPIQSQDETDFTEIKIPARPPIAPEAPSSPTMAMPNVTPPTATSAPVTPIVTTTPSPFALPKVEVIPPSLPEFPVVDEPPAIAPNSNSGEAGAETTGGYGASSAGNGQDLLGGKISAAARIAVVIDVSGSMTAFDAIAKECIEGLYKKAKFYPAMNAIGRGLNPDAKESPTDEAKKPPIDGVWKDALEADHYDVSQQPPTTGNLYDTVYLALEDHPEAVVIITDFEDGYFPWATTDLVSALRAKHIKLIVLSREMAAYPGLPEYSQESGGSYSFVQIDAHAATVTSLQPNPTLPPRGPLADADGVIAREIRILEDSYSGLRRVTYYQKDQDSRDDGTRQLLLYCVQHPNPGKGQLMALMGGIGSEMRPVAANPGADASAAHVAQLIIPVVMQSQDQTMLRFLPELIRNTANCRNSIPAQAYSNAEGVLLACEEYIDGLAECPRRLASAILQAVTLCQGSSNPQVQTASRYLRFALGDRTGLDACLAEVSRTKNDPIEARLLKRIAIPDGVAGDKLDYIAQHRESLIFDGTTGIWHFQSLPPAAPTAFSASNQTNAAPQMTP